MEITHELMEQAWEGLIRNATNNRYFECPVCSMGSFHVYDLRDTNTNSPTVRYQCDACGHLLSFDAVTLAGNYAHLHDGPIRSDDL